MFCKNCGISLSDDALFCENCGTAVRTAEPPKADPIPAAPVFAEAEPFANPIAVEDSFQNMSTQAPVKPKKTFPVWIIVAAIAAVVVLAVVLFAGGGSGNSEQFYHELNYNNVAFFAYDSDRLYFVCEYDDDADGTSVFSTSHNGVNKKLISNNEDIVRIRVVDGKIYYYESGDETYRLGVMDTDGSNDRTIVSPGEYVSKYDVSDKQLYYLVDSGLYACDLDGENNTCLVEKADTFVLGNGVIYYVADDVITEYNLKKGTSAELCKSAGATDLALNGSTLYFACDSGLSSVDVKGDGSITRIINDSELDSYVFHDGYIYYCRDFTTDEIAEIAEYLADDSDEVWTYRLLLIGSGKLYCANADGSDAHEVENTDDTVVFSLYTSPNGLYYKMTAFSSTINTVDFE